MSEKTDGLGSKPVVLPYQPPAPPASPARDRSVFGLTGQAFAAGLFTGLIIRVIELGAYQLRLPSIEAAVSIFMGVIWVGVPIGWGWWGGRKVLEDPHGVIVAKKVLTERGTRRRRQWRHLLRIPLTAEHAPESRCFIGVKRAVVMFIGMMLMYTFAMLLSEVPGMDPDPPLMAGLLSIMLGTPVVALIALIASGGRRLWDWAVQ